MVAGGLCKDPLASRIGTPRKALARLQGRSALAWTLDAVRDSGLGPCVVVSGPDVDDEVHFGERIDELGSAVDNAVAGAQALDADRVLLLPTDSPLMTGEMLRRFAEYVEGRQAHPFWFAAGLCRYRVFRQHYPSADATPLGLKEGRFLSGALFATTPSGLERGRDLFNEIRHSRKSQLAMVKKFGLTTVLRYFLRQITLAEAEERLSRALDGQAILYGEAEPETVLDFDTVREWESVERAMLQRAEAQPEV